MLDLVGRDAIVRVEPYFDIGIGSGRLSGPLHVIGAHPLDANRLAEFLGKNDGFIFGAGIAPIRASVVSGTRISLDGDFIDGSAEHHGNLPAEGLRILRVSMNGDSPVAKIGRAHV